MKTILTSLVIVLFLPMCYARNNDSIQFNSGFGFSAKFNSVNSFVDVVNDKEKWYGTGTLWSIDYDFGLYYKGFSINYAPPIKTSSHIDQYSGNYSSNTGLMSSFFYKKYGVRVYWQNFYGYTVQEETMQDYRPDWNANKGEQWAQDMSADNYSLNLYYLLLGKKSMNDYFFSPNKTQRSKIGVYNVLSLDKRRIYNTEDLIIREAEEDYTGLSEGFDFNQLKADLGLGVSGTLFLGPFYLALNIAYSYGLVKVNNTIGEEPYTKTYFDHDFLNLSYHVGIQSKLFQFEIGGIFEGDYGRLNDSYAVNFQSSNLFLKGSVRFPTREEMQKERQ